MKVPEGVLEAGGQDAKSLYGLKQARRVWNHRINATLRALGYDPTVSDHCVCRRKDATGWHYLALYVDDPFYVSSDQP